MIRSKLTIAILGLLTGMSMHTMAANRTVENPAIASTNTFYIDFRSVELSDTATVLNVHANFRPKNWISIAPETVLSADGKDYKLKGGNGIEPGKRFWMPESGEADFSLIFEPVPENTTTIDFKEPNDGWKLWGIDLTGKADYLSPHPDMPNELLENKAPFFYEPVFENGTTTVNIHLLGYNPEMGNKLSYTLQTLSGQITDMPELKIAPDGTCEPLTFNQSGTVKLNLDRTNSGVNIYGSILLAPGETTELYTDCRVSGQILMRQREGKDKIQEIPFIDNGKYSYTNRLANNEYAQNEDYYLFIYTRDFGRYDMSGDEYTDYVIEKYNDVVNKIKEDNIPDDISIMLINDAKMTLLTAMVNYEQIQALSYLKVKDEGDLGEEAFKAVKTFLKPEHFKKVAEIVQLDDPQLLLSEDFSIHIMTSERLAKSETGSRQVKDLGLFKNLYDKASAGRLTQENLDSARNQFSRPFYAEAIEIHDKEIKERLSKLDASLMTPIPDVEAEKVFDTIIGEHKGKVIMVDLWNTWCGPCRQAIKATEPEKSGDLSSEDIVWIYIANESSPLEKYLSVIPDIKGIHYRLDSETWDNICKRFNVDGIPFYILVDRKGIATGRPDLRNHSLYKKALLDEVNKK